MILKKIKGLIYSEEQIRDERTKAANSLKIKSIELNCSPLSFGHYGIRISVQDSGYMKLIKIPQGSFSGNDIGYVTLDELVKFRSELNKFLEQTESGNIMFSLPSHAHLTKRALEVHAAETSELNMAKHQSFVDGGVWMLDECIKYLESNGG